MPPRVPSALGWFCSCSQASSSLGLIRAGWASHTADGQVVGDRGHLRDGRVQVNQLEADEQTVLDGGSLVDCELIYHGDLILGGLEQFSIVGVGKLVAYANLRRNIFEVRHEQVDDEVKRDPQMFETKQLLVNALPASIETLVEQTLYQILVLVVAVATVLIVADQRVNQADDQRIIVHADCSLQAGDQCTERGGNTGER
uniref:Uncharacterized protein n=1 Tax=Anopheles maculatus TaxID=74869 RepID=A0A182T913_9DIPT